MLFQTIPQHQPPLYTHLSPSPTQQAFYILNIKQIKVKYNINNRRYSMIPQATIQEAVDLLKKAAKPKKIILFGSYARGNPREDSDLDFLVVEKELKARRMEMVRLSDVLRPLRIPVDVLVASEKVFNEWADTPGTVLYEAAKEGKVLYEKT